LSIQSLEGLPLHTRSLTITISRESDSLWLARGDVIDLRKNGFVPSSYDLQPSGLIHSMSIELVFDPKSLRIERIAIDQPFVAVEPSEATGGECCRDPAPRLLDLGGDHLDAGFTKRLSAHFGGARGCSHLLTLFQLMASTIPRAARLENARIAREQTQARFGERFFRRSVFIDGHLRSDDRVDVAVQLSDTHSRPRAAEEPATKRLECSYEWKLLATVERMRFQIQRLSAAQRERRFETLGRADWISHDALLSPLVDLPLIPGMAGRVFQLLAGGSELEPLRDALLQFAPGFIQILAALIGDSLAERAQAEPRTPASPSDVASLGASSNNCYMWREGGPISRSWSRAQSSDDG
jgi:hypothetical protein